MIGKRFRPLPFIFANDNYTLRTRLEAIFFCKQNRSESGQNKYTLRVFFLEKDAESAAVCEQIVYFFRLEAL